MKAERGVWRLRDVKHSITEIRALLADLTFEAFVENRTIRAATERYLEIMSEAARHIPDEWRQEVAPEIPWRRVSDLGNHLRHAYHKTDPEILWYLYEDQFDVLEAAVDRMIQRYADASRT